MNTYKVGVIGCGRIASLMEQDEHRDKPTTHAGCYDLVQRTQIVAAADSHEERLQAFGRRWNVQRLYSSYEEMMDSEELDIVSICTYPVGKPPSSRVQAVCGRQWIKGKSFSRTP